MTKCMALSCPKEISENPRKAANINEMQKTVNVSKSVNGTEETCGLRLNTSKATNTYGPTRKVLPY